MEAIDLACLGTCSRCFKTLESGSTHCWLEVCSIFLIWWTACLEEGGGGGMKYAGGKQGGQD